MPLLHSVSALIGMDNASAGADGLQGDCAADIVQIVEGFF
jgi:hypothetical protein